MVALISAVALGDKDTSLRSAESCSNFSCLIDSIFSSKTSGSNWKYWIVP